jgi:replication factor C subunit 2/4
MVMMDSVLKDGFPALQILTQLAEAVVASGEDADLVKSRVCARIAEADKVGSDQGLDHSPSGVSVLAASSTT